ncbi:MAG: ROK family transcriptional regulator [Anaerolineae bacterium]|nr:ROK family transcriptional regulator [Anaerolineae bacterium]MCX8067703.1 ROK family transcriptional regulator [Anaerolineae bacterium]MDW7992770.1 ROK family transcriptional regulator [Anaerolineae bacterium]MDW8069155.1 ROK family transcriptional regulator [Anaerolineae bacterium]
MTRAPTTADQVLVRKLNTSLIMECLRTSGPLSRAGLSSTTGLNRSTVSSIIHDLLEKNLVREIGFQPSARTGRPGILLELNPDGGCAIGVEIGVDFISAVLTDFVARVLWRRRIPTHPEEKQERIIQKAEEIVEEALAIGKAYGLSPLGIGLGVPGLVNIQEGTLVFAPNLRWFNVPLKQMWTQRFGIPVYVENEANAAALGEYYFGNARGVQNLIYLSAGVGLGGGIIIKGRLFRGSNGYAGEIGHMTVDPSGELCGCGKRGCWETMVGPRAIVRRVRRALENGQESSILSAVENDLDRIDINVVVQAAQDGDSLARAALEEVGVHLGIGISNLVNAFNPEMVVLGGALSLAGSLLLPVIEETVRAHALPQPREALTLATSAHGADACVMGAVALVLDEILREPMLPML